jgi:choline/glycine/proline betaine transport protein
MPTFAYPEMDRDPDGDEHYYRAEVFLRRGGQAYDVYGYDQQDIISDILDQFEKYLHFLHVSPGILPWQMEEHDDDLSKPEDAEEEHEHPEIDAGLEAFEEELEKEKKPNDN